jgi:hypothetical protein
MTEGNVLGELDWEHAVQDIPEAGLAVERSASQGEREEIARALELLSCAGLTARYRLTLRGGGHVQLSGTLWAQVEQTCVVTLEPLVNEISENFSVDYWPETEMPEPGSGPVDMHDGPDLEPIVDGRIAVGRVVFDCLANAIDLFPRKPGVSFEAPEDGGGNPESPFSALAKFKNKR